jgi:tRNA(Ile)-lysidine synthase
MGFCAVSLRAVLDAHVPGAATGLVIAISGGADSACLLTALAQPDAPPFRSLPVRAVHVDHGLQPAAAGLQLACEELCRRLKVPLTVVRVSVAAGGSIEAAARAARYAGLAEQLAAGECLLTAHHAEDQAETVLLQLLRGAGLKGLSAMPVCRPWRGGWHVRPLLDVAQRDLRLFGAAMGVAAAADPMNHDLRFDRVFLREQLWPVLERRWPGAAAALSRAARHAADAQELLDESAELALRTLRDGTTLSVTGLRRLTVPAQLNVLRYWSSTCGDARPPSAARLREALRQVVTAEDGQLPAIVWGEHALRRYRDRLFLTRAQPPRLGEPREWRIAAGAPLELGEGLGTLQWSPQGGGLDHGRLPATLVVRRRRGGETLKPQRRARQSLQHLCQSLGVVPWMRDALPLIYAGNDLIAVGDLWQDARWCVAPGAPGFGCDWHGAPLLT